MSRDISPWEAGAACSGWGYRHEFVVKEVDFLLCGERYEFVERAHLDFCEGRLHAIITKGLMRDE